VYSYSIEKPRIFTEDGQRMFLAIRDKANELLDAAGAVSSGKLFCVSGETWQMLACMDRLIELGELREITGPNVAGQDRVFVRAKR
jgi:hypothetical protein